MNQKKIDDNNPPSKNFSEIFDILDYSILVILTKDNKKFGAFINNKNKQKNINVQNNNNFINDDLIFNNLMINQNNNNLMFNQNNNNLMINKNKNINFGMNSFDRNIPNAFDNFNTINSNNFILFFDSKSSLGEYFIFSLDKMKIYYSNEQNEGNIRFPNFNF